ncbi:MAG: uracil-DNA glycosylase [Bdellovibrionales bacterium]
MENSTSVSVNTPSKTSDDSIERIKLDPSWKIPLLKEFQSLYMADLRTFLKKELKAKKTIYPKGPNIFNALNLCPLDQVRVVILGQDPYHGPGQAHGLCFSVKKGVAPPPSLINVFKELKADLGMPMPDHGCLEKWAKQGVLLLNTALTVEHGKAASHQGRGWERFTDEIIRLVDQLPHSVVFLLWGSPAQKKAELIKSKQHLILKSPHPSPLSAHRGFLGNKHFSKTNAHLKAQGLREVDWSLD